MGKNLCCLFTISTLMSSSRPGLLVVSISIPGLFVVSSSSPGEYLVQTTHWDGGKRKISSMHEVLPQGPNIIALQSKLAVWAGRWQLWQKLLWFHHKRTTWSLDMKPRPAPAEPRLSWSHAFSCDSILRIEGATVIGSSFPADRRTRFDFLTLSESQATWCPGLDLNLSWIENSSHGIEWRSSKGELSCCKEAIASPVLLNNAAHSSTPALLLFMCCWSGSSLHKLLLGTLTEQLDSS